MKRKAQDPRIAQKVIEMVAAHYKTTPDVLKSDEGDKIGRQVVMHILKVELGGTLRAAREAVNVKADMTVYSATKAITALLRTDTALASRIEEIKAEALMIAAVPENTPVSEPKPRMAWIRRNVPNQVPERESTTFTSRDTPSEATGHTTTKSTAQTIGNVLKAVTGVFLGSDLLSSSDPAAEVLLAKDAVVFLVWDDFPKITKAEILNAFHLDQDGLYRAIGRISFSLKEDGSGLKRKLKAARSAYSPA